MPIRSYEDLSRHVDAAGGVHTLDMGELRDIHGAGKLGVNVVSNISEALEHRGLGHVPTSLPLNQWEKARIYKKSSNVGELINAVMAVNDEKSDETLRELSKNNAQAVIRQIRSLVCE